MKHLILILLSILFISCAKTESEFVQTSGIHTQFEVIKDADGDIECRATFQVGDGVGGTYLDLTGDDEVYCNGVKLRRSNLFGIVDYRANISANRNNSYHFKFKRDGESYESITELPADVTFISPNPYERVKKDEPLSVEWFRDMNNEAAITVQHYQVLSNDKNQQQKSSHYTKYQRPEVGYITFDNVLDFQGTGQVDGQVTITRTRKGRQAPGLNGVVRGKVIDKNSFYFVD
jgi:hypothetical protein